MLQVPSSRSRPERLPLAIVALAACTFAFGTAEFAIMGVLPEVAAGFDVSIPTAGHLMSAYAIGVVVGAPLLTAAGTRLPRRRLLVLLMGCFTVGSVLSAAAPSYGWMLVGRVVTALPHGAVMGIGAVVATQLVPPHRRAAAITGVFLGLTIANVAGAPLSTALGQALGWRSTFWLLVGVGAVSMVAVALLVPAGPRPAGASLRGELRTLRRPRVVLLLGTTVVAFAAVFASYGYVAPQVTDVAGLPEGATVWVMATFGIGMTAGNLLSARLQGGPLGRRPRVLVTGALLALVGALSALIGLAHGGVTIFVGMGLLGVVVFVAVPIIQARVIELTHDAPTLSAASVHAAFNTANAIGPLLAGLAIDGGHGVASVNVVALGLALTGLLLWLGGLGVVRRIEARPVPA